MVSGRFTPGKNGAQAFLKAIENVYFFWLCRERPGRYVETII
jgi:hypothetical protein